MLIYAKAALKQTNVTLQNISEHVKDGKKFGNKAILPSHEFEDSRRKQWMMSANNGRSGDMRDTEFWRNHDVYDKLERLLGHKVFGKRGILDYKGVKIMFNKKIYQKDSMDDL